MIVGLLFLVTFIFLLWHIDKKPKGLPPGPWGLPLVGDLTTGGIISAEKLREMKSRYGNVFSQRVGSLFCVYLADFDTIRSTFSRPEFQGRPFFYPLKGFCFFKNIGIIDSTDEVWMNNRRFAMKQLRDLGLGKSRIQSSIQREAQEIVSILEKQGGKPTYPESELNVTIVNIIWQLVANTRYEVEDENMKFFMNVVDAIFETLQGPAIALSAFPWLEKLLPTFLLNKLFKIEKLFYLRDQISGFMKDIIDDHVQRLNPENPKDFIDHFLIENGKGKSYGLSEHDYMNLSSCLVDLFVAGSETTSTTLRWFILLMAAHPEEQEKARSLVDETVPRSRQPSLEDREQLTYIDAVLMETMRFSSFTRLGLAHSATEDSKIAGYSIPKGCTLIPCVQLCHYSAEYYERPTEFYPNHFIGENGELLSKKLGYAPFSIGRRLCLGESLAKTELFIFATTILQNFTIESHPDHPLDLGFDKSKALYNFTKPYKVCFVKRPL